MKIIRFITILIILIHIHASHLYPSQFEELDKPPEGIHKNQLYFTIATSIGAPYGKIITAEENFTKNSTYTFSNEITKRIYISHLAFGFSFCGEFLPLDFIGIRTKLCRTIIVQNTQFGSDYPSWKKTVYSNYSVFLGASFHITNRKPWDICITPTIGYSLARYSPTPIAKILIDNYKSPPTEEFSSFLYGSDLILSFFFNGGLVIQLGSEWIRIPIKFSSTPSAVNPQTNRTFFTNKKATINSYLFFFSAGYALYH